MNNLKKHQPSNSINDNPYLVDFSFNPINFTNNHSCSNNNNKHIIKLKHNQAISIEKDLYLHEYYNSNISNLVKTFTTNN